MENRVNLEIDGMKKAAGGNYGNVVIHGSAKFEGNCNILSLLVHGAGKIEGNLDAKEVQVNGSLKVEGNTQIKKLLIAGEMKCEGDLKTEKLHVSGVLKSDEYVMYADEIIVDGVIKNENEINADHIVVHGKVKAQSMVGDRIEIATSKLDFGLFAKPERIHRVNWIECTNLQATALKCESISAHDVTLSKYCKVDKVYCDGTLTYDASCQIGMIEGNPTMIER